MICWELRLLRRCRLILFRTLRSKDDFLLPFRSEETSCLYFAPLRILAPLSEAKQTSSSPVLSDKLKILKVQDLALERRKKGDRFHVESVPVLIRAFRFLSMAPSAYRSSHLKESHHDNNTLFPTVAEPQDMIHDIL